MYYRTSKYMDMDEINGKILVHTSLAKCYCFEHFENRLYCYAGLYTDTICAVNDGIIISGVCGKVLSMSLFLSAKGMAHKKVTINMLKCR